MNRGVLQSSHNWWNINNMRPPITHHHHHQHQQQQQQASSPFLAPPPNFFPQYSPTIPTSSSMPLSSDQDQLPESWSQLLLGGLVGEEERLGLSQKMENWEEQLMNQPCNNGSVIDVKQENSANNYMYGHGNNVEFHNQIVASAAAAAVKPITWSQMIPISSPKSCVTTLSSNNMLDFTNNNSDSTRHPPPDHSSECNSTATGGVPNKKARVQPSSTQSTFKVRKEKLGDRITALHQIVSPFGKTDTASVLLEAIGYIRFLQSQIEALSLPYLSTGSANIRPQQQQQQSVQGERNCLFPEDPGQLLNGNCMKRKVTNEQDCHEEPKKDLRSRGLCLVPISCTLKVGSDNGADYWAPAIGGGFR